MTTYHHVLELLSEEESRKGGSDLPWLWFTFVRYAWLLPFLKARVVGRAKRLTRQLEDMSLRMSGFARRYERSLDRGDAQKEEASIRLAQTVEDHAMRIRGEVLEMVQMVRPHASEVPELMSALSAWSSAATEAWETAQELRWVIMEYQAQQDIDEGRVHSFESAADAIASLRA